jgi:hypothetical protein
MHEWLPGAYPVPLSDPDQAQCDYLTQLAKFEDNFDAIDWGNTDLFLHFRSQAKIAFSPQRELRKPGWLNSAFPWLIRLYSRGRPLE